MEKYLIIKTEKEKYLKDYPVLECEHSIGIDYDGYISINGYISIKCKKITGTCTYKNSSKNEYLNCKLLKD